MPISGGRRVDPRIDLRGHAVVTKRRLQLANRPGGRRRGGNRIARVHNNGHALGGATEAMRSRQTRGGAGVFQEASAIHMSPIFSPERDQLKGAFNCMKRVRFALVN